jgi:NAD(P)-dependent dehydrogenase (short-subunit alcohol dehydrogenase family)
MSVEELSGTTAIVTGASRGFGRAIALSLAAHNVHVVGVATTARSLDEVGEQLGDNFTAELADASEPSVATRLISRYRPRTVVLNAGATPAAGSLQHQTWENFSLNWVVDVRQVFNFAREALLAPLPRGSAVISMSSGAALRGSPLSGGYAGAKATVRFISAYAGLEAVRNALDIRFVSVLPQITPATDLGAKYVEVYAGFQGLDVETYLSQLGPTLSLKQAGESIVELASGGDYTAPAYLLNGSGLSPV